MDFDLPEPGEPGLTDSPFTFDNPRSPAQVEADMRQRLGIESWELYGAVWVESLVEGLCVR